MATILNRQVTFATNGTVTAAGLHNLIDQTEIYAGIITTQDQIASVGSSDQLLIADADETSTSAPRRVTVGSMFNDALNNGIYTTGSFTNKVTAGSFVGNLTGNVTGTIVGTSGTLAGFNSTTGTIVGLNSTTGTIVTGTVSTLNSTTGTIATLNSTTGTIGTLNSTTGTIANLSTTLSGDLTISAGSATAGTRLAVVNTAQEYTATHNFNATTLTSGNSISWPLASNQVARLALSTNGTMADATGKVDGATYMLIVTQATGSNTLAWNATYKFPNAITPTLTTGVGVTDIFTFVSNGTSMFGVASQNYAA
jgi:hypothetical protein